MISAPQSLQDKKQQTAATERRPEKVLAAWAVDPKHRGSAPEKLSRATTVTPCRERWRLKHRVCAHCRIGQRKILHTKSLRLQQSWVATSQQGHHHEFCQLRNQGSKGQMFWTPISALISFLGATNPYTLMHAVDFPSTTPADHWIQFQWSEAN